MTADQKMDKCLKILTRKGNTSLVEYSEQPTTPEEDLDF
jgi:hypothetical protein